MAGIRLDGAGQAKLSTLEDAVTAHQRIHALVEQYALAIKRNTPGSAYLMTLRRQLPALAGLLKGQFGMISDQVTAMNLQISRGSNDAARIRQAREGVGQIGQALEIAMKGVIEKHKVEDKKESDAAAE